MLIAVLYYRITCKYVHFLHIYITYMYMNAHMNTYVQFDFQSQSLSSIQHGVRTKRVEFTDITGYQSEVMADLFTSQVLAESQGRLYTCILIEIRRLCGIY